MKTIKKHKVIKLLLLVSLTPTAAVAEDAWQVQSSLIGFSGHYTDSFVLKKQQGKSLRIKAEKDQNWGLAVGYQSSNIDLQPVIPSPQQNQDDWLISTFAHMPTTWMPGKLTLQMDFYRIMNNAEQSKTNNVRAFVPQIIWESHELPLKMDFSYSNSDYKNGARVHQVSTGLAYGFNNYKNWIQVRTYYLDNLKTLGTYEKNNEISTDVKLTQIFNGTSPLIPASVTVGMEFGKKIYYVDVTSQTLQNAPLMNKEGKNIAVNWRVSDRTNFDLFYNQNAYHAYEPWKHQLKLNTAGVKINRTW